MLYRGRKKGIHQLQLQKAGGVDLLALKKKKHHCTHLHFDWLKSVLEGAQAKEKGTDGSRNPGATSFNASEGIRKFY